MLVLQDQQWLQNCGKVLLCTSPGWWTAQQSKKNVKSAVVFLSITRQLGCAFQDMEPPKSTTILRKSSNILKPFRCVRFTEVVLRHANIRDQNPSLGMICPGELHQRNPNAPKFEDRSQEQTEWQERCAREAAWRLAKNILKIKEKQKKHHSSHLRRIGACLHQQANQRKDNFSWTPERRCTWSAKRIWIRLNWKQWRHREDRRR